MFAFKLKQGHGQHCNPISHLIPNLADMHAYVTEEHVYSAYSTQP